MKRRGRPSQCSFIQSADLAPTQDRHDEIADHEIHRGALTLEQPDGGGTVAGLEYPVAAFLKGPRNQLPDEVFIVHDQDRAWPAGCRF